MRHVTDGELHAYLDGGLDVLPEGRGGVVRRHVDRCEACASRLEEARALRSRVDEILGMASTDVTGAPSLEELRRLAATSDDAAPGGGPEVVAPADGGTRRTGSRGPRGRTSLRWAATVMVALGAGWLWGITGGPGPAADGPAPARSASSEEASEGGPAAAGIGEDRVAADVEPSVAPAVAESVDAPAPVGEPVAGERSSPPAEAAEVGEERVASASSAATLAEDRRDADARAAEDRSRGVERMRLGEPSADRAEADRTPEPAALGDRLAIGWVPLAGAASNGRPGTVRADSVSALPRTAAGAGELLPDSPPDPGTWTSLDSSRPEDRRAIEVLGLRRDASSIGAGIPMREERTRPTSADERARSRMSAQGAIDPGSLTVPGLDVVSVEWTRVAPETTGIRVVQRLVTGGTIELRFGGLTDGSTAPEYLREERLPEGLRQVVLDFRNGWLVARAPLEPEQIRALVALIR